MLHIFYSLSLESLWAKNIYFFVKQSLSFVINCLKFLDLQNPKVNPLVLPNKGTLNNCRPSTVSWFKSKGHEFLPTKKRKRNKKKPQQKNTYFYCQQKSIQPNQQQWLKSKISTGGAVWRMAVSLLILSVRIQGDGRRVTWDPLVADQWGGRKLSGEIWESHSYIGGTGLLTFNMYSTHRWYFGNKVIMRSQWSCALWEVVPWGLSHSKDMLSSTLIYTNNLY